MGGPIFIVRSFAGLTKVITGHSVNIFHNPLPSGWRNRPYDLDCAAACRLVHHSGNTSCPGTFALSSQFLPPLNRSKLKTKKQLRWRGRVRFTNSTGQSLPNLWLPFPASHLGAKSTFRKLVAQRDRPDLYTIWSLWEPILYVLVKSSITTILLKKPGVAHCSC